MRGRAVLSIAICLVGALALVACGDDDQAARTAGTSTTSTDASSTTTSSTTTPPAGGGHSATTTTRARGTAPTTSGLVITVDTAGGFVPVENQVGNTADLVLLGDGSLITPAPMTMIYPGPAMAPFQVGHAPADQVQAAVRAIRALDPNASYSPTPPNQIADAPDTVLTMTNGSEHVRISAYALGMSGQEQGPRAKLQAVVEQLQGLGDGSGQHAYTPTALRVHDVTPQVGPAAEPSPGEPKGRVLDWPIPQHGEPCTVVRDPQQVSAALAVLAHATQLDRFRTAAGERRLVVVPLLPGDPGCR